MARRGLRLGDLKDQQRFARRLKEVMEYHNFALKNYYHVEPLDYDTVLRDNLRVMDATAIALCRENSLPIIVFKLRQHGNIRRVVFGNQIGSVVSDGTI